ncbi:MAG: tRNA uridine-5-carboxymethylaminomethyl(34) synthesis enzyme MnmG [Candidatus Bostrichicola ureolyticus]|nr:MAG: tRNA uridine-5-carboxymethylaminomethyl(34) synthesis enzyme MnmG [Candidatus Bostrichicola ureolyticus]
MFINYDVIVVGGGHAGAEAAAAAANMGSNTLLITMNIQLIGNMSCNPAIGGIAKGQIVREIDALGGYSGIITDKTMIQFRMLNKSKGPAMWSPRAQSDRIRFTEEWRLTLEAIPNLDLFQDTVTSLLIKGDKVIGVCTIMGLKIKSKSVILTNGTFLNGVIHIGNKKINGGRISEKSSFGITEQLKNLGFSSGRMKTGTSPRVDGRSLNYSKMFKQQGDNPSKQFSYLNTINLNHQRNCYITYTNEQVHDIIRNNLDKSPIFNGSIKSKGPRYCPSIEDKIYRFQNKDQHQIFIEPEGWNTIEVYINGFSTSLPAYIQYKAMQKISGFEMVKIFKIGYAIEYDYFPPTQLNYNLETKIINNLFFAGQINGTTGYEEAAAQGIIAGINAHLKINEKDPFILKRNEAYIGVLIDDLINKGTQEPYRMFTSRAEHRMLLRQDNADERLTPISYKLNLASIERMQKLENKLKKIKSCLFFFENKDILPEEINTILKEKKLSLINKSNKINVLLLRPEISIKDIVSIPIIYNYIKEHNLNEEILEEVSIQIKYKTYIEKELKNANKLLQLENISIPSNFDYSIIKSLSYEAIEKLNLYKPFSIGQAYRISGISPSDINILLLYIHTKKKIKRKK